MASEKEDDVQQALVHDIGKIGVDDAVLSKPGALGPAEQAAMMAHACEQCHRNGKDFKGLTYACARPES